MGGGKIHMVTTARFSRAMHVVMLTYESDCNDNHDARALLELDKQSQ